MSAVERPEATRRAISTLRDIAFVSANDCRDLPSTSPTTENKD
jgi:hypothetical protein